MIIYYIINTTPFILIYFYSEEDFRIFEYNGQQHFVVFNI
jgi:hypothetical protein